MQNVKKHENGLNIPEKAVSTADQKGDIEVVGGKVQYHNGTAVSPVVTESHSATLTNKTIDADLNTVSNLETENLKSGVLITSTTLVGASDTSVPSSLAIKTYTDTEVTAEETRALAAENTIQTNLNNHINDTGDAHDASAISTTAIVGVAGGLASDVQAVASDLKSQIDTKAASTDLTTHTGASTGVHGVAGSVVGTTDTQTLSAKTIVAASNTITTAAVGNLVATELNAALSELQSDVDTRALDADLDSHTVATEAHGATGAVVGTTNTQTLTNKTLTSPAINTATITSPSLVTPSRLDVKQGTAASLATYASTATSGQLAYSTDSKILYVIKDSGLTTIATGAAGDLVVQSKTASYTVLSTDGVVLVDASTGANTQTLPTAVGISGRIISIMKTDSSTNLVTIDGNGTETINGDLTRTLGTQYDVVRLVSDGSNWVIIAGGETVAARYSTNAGQTIATAIINFEDITYDTHNAVTIGASWKFTAPISGKYSISANVQTFVTPSVGDTFALIMYKNNVDISLGPRDTAESTTTRRMAGHISDTVSLNKGDFIDIRMSDAISPVATLEADNATCYISIERVGN